MMPRRSNADAPASRVANGEQMALVMLIGGVGNHMGAWRRPTSRVEEKYGLQLFAELARSAEAAKIHAVFLADSLQLDLNSVRNQPFFGLEPVTLLSALSAVTEQIGLIGSISTTFSEPFTVARQLASLDFLSHGRAGWNLVTSVVGGDNYGRELPPHDLRYERGAEFAEALIALWDTWEPDAIVVDRERGIYADVAKIHAANFEGRHFSIRGPLNVARSPQGHPIIAQSGSSEAGQNVAARFADLVYTTGRTSEAESIDFYRSLKSRVRSAGREPSQVKVIPGVSPIVGETEAAAKTIEKELNGYLDLELGRAQLARRLAGVELGDLGLDEAVPLERLPPVEAIDGIRSRYGVYVDLISEGWTLRRLIEWELSAFGHFVVVGAPEQIAELLIERFEAGAADGSVLMPSHVPEGFKLLAEAVVPTLQERGAFQRDYAGTTLRENLRLAPLTAQAPNGRSTKIPAPAVSRR